MWFYLLVLDFTQGFFFLAVLKPTVNESFSVGIMLPPVPVYPNSYMLDMRSNKQEERRCGLKPQRQQERKLNTKK